MRPTAVLLIAALLLLGAVPVIAALVPLLDAPSSAFAELLSSRVLLLVGRTALLGAAVAAGATVLGTAGALALSRRRGALTGLLSVLLPLPFVLPSWMAGMAWA